MQFAQPNTRFLVATRDYGLPKRKHELEHGTLIITFHTLCFYCLLKFPPSRLNLIYDSLLEMVESVSVKIMGSTEC